MNKEEVDYLDIFAKFQENFYNFHKEYKKTKNFLIQAHKIIEQMSHNVKVFTEEQKLNIIRKAKKEVEVEFLDLIKELDVKTNSEQNIGWHNCLVEINRRLKGEK